MRTLASDPTNSNHLFLGTSDGHIFGSTDAGDHWSLLGRAGRGWIAWSLPSLWIHAIRNSMCAATWTQDPTAGGGVYHSENGGETWQAAGLLGTPSARFTEAARSTVCLSPAQWTDFFVPRTEEIPGSASRRKATKNFAISIPSPWIPTIRKSFTREPITCPGKHPTAEKHWAPVHDGMIDDSDVMSLLVDRTHPRRVYASACSGIYLSEDSAAGWRKIQGIPYSARRTQAILQDPGRPATVYAATTEGLWITANAGLQLASAHSRRLGCELRCAPQFAVAAL